MHKSISKIETFGENTILFEVSYDNFEDIQDGSMEEVFDMTFEFFEYQYHVRVAMSDIERDFPSVGIDGDSTLFDSFEKLCEGDMWEFIKKQCLNCIKNGE